MVLEKTLESPLGCKEIKPVNPKGYQHWIFIRRTNAEAESLILWPPDAENWLIWEDPDAGKDSMMRAGEEDEIFGQHHWFNGYHFEQIPEDGEGQGTLECYSPWGCKELETTVQLNNKHSITQLELAESVDVESWTQRAGSTIIHEFSTAQGGWCP